MRWVEQLLATPPRCLSQLERIVGRIDVDFADLEGMGSVVRMQPFERGQLVAGVLELVASFHYDMHHEDMHRPRDMTLDNYSVMIELSPSELDALLVARFGEPRTFERDASGRRIHHREYGAFFYTSNARATEPWLEWHLRRPEWAIPKPRRGVHEDFLATLVDRLATEDDAAAIVTALAPLAIGCDATVELGGDGLVCLFRPGMALAHVVAALRWDDPLAYSSDMTMTGWNVVPLARFDDRVGHAVAVGGWLVHVVLEGLPRGPERAPLPTYQRFEGSLRHYDVRTADTRVFSIRVSPATRRE